MKREKSISSVTPNNLEEEKVSGAAESPALDVISSFIYSVWIHRVSFQNLLNTITFLPLIGIGRFENLFWSGEVGIWR